MAKIEVIKQQDLKDCGACSLSSIIKYYGGYVPLEKIREDTCTNSKGTTAYHIINAARRYGFDGIGVKVDTLEDENIYFPAIGHVILKNGLEHFVVIYKISNNYVWLMDPAKGKMKMKKDEFKKNWDNILIMLTPENDIIKFNEEISISSILIKLIKKNKNLFLIICLISIFLMFISIFSNFYFQLAISSIENNNDNNFLKFIIILFLILILFKIIFNYAKNYYLNFFSRNLDTEIFTEFLKHIFNLPLKFIQNRTTGEIISRVEELSDLKSMLTEFFTNILLNSVLVLGAVVALYLISNKLFFILCLIIITYLIIGLLFSKLIYNHIKLNIESVTDFNSTLIENVEMNTSIKNLNLIDEFIKRLENKLIIMLKNNFKTQSFLNAIELLKNFIYEIGIYLVTTYGIYLVYRGDLNVLNLVTFNSIILYLFNPIKEFIDLTPKYNYLKASFKKISDFINVGKETDTEGLNNITKTDIIMSNVTYSYNKFTNILKNINLKINEYDKVLLIGPSGSGKSTICKLLCKYYLEYTGMIEIGNASEKDYKLTSFRENILYVGQNEKLFTGSIRENIICFRNINEKEFLDIIRICRIEEIINKRPNRYNALINASLNNLSGGEKQRIILARSLLKKAKIIILDEALSEVNETLEREIIEDLLKHFSNKTIIYISHKNVHDKFSKIIDMGEINV